MPWEGGKEKRTVYGRVFSEKTRHHRKNHKDIVKPPGIVRVVSSKRKRGRRGRAPRNAKKLKTIREECKIIRRVLLQRGQRKGLWKEKEPDIKKNGRERGKIIVNPKRR